MTFLSSKSLTDITYLQTKQQKPAFSSLIAIMLLSLSVLSACGGSDGAIPDTVAPIITLNGEAIIDHNYGDVYTDSGASATDNVDGSVMVVTNGSVTVDMINSYTITYAATDAAGNTNSIERTVNVADIAGPVITLNGETTIDHNYGDVYTDLGASATDNLDGSVTVVTSGSVTVEVINSYTITYTATDAAGNTNSIERTVNVADIAGPVITLNGDSTVTLGKGRVYQELGAIAFDNLDGEAVVDAPLGTVDYDNVGHYELTYNATDAAGNTSTAIRSVEVVAPKPFITTWKTDNRGISADNEITITTNPAFAAEYDYNVDWGDGTTDEHLTGDYIHTYNAAGTYTVTISGSFPQLYFEVTSAYYYNEREDVDAGKLLSVEQWGDGILLSLHKAFNYCINLNINANDTPNFRFVTDMSYMFFKAKSLNQDISAWDVSSVTDMSWVFGYAATFNQDISAWDVSSVTDMGGGHVFICRNI